MNSTINMKRTSFHDNTVRASFNEINAVIANPPCNRSNNGQEKSNFEWNGLTIDGDVYSIYDWKEYRQITEDEQIDWHIGGHSRIQTSKIANILELDLNKLRLNRL